MVYNIIIALEANNMGRPLGLKQANTVCFLNIGRTDFFGAANSYQPTAA
jgi:hypothetical protein